MKNWSLIIALTLMGGRAIACEKGCVEWGGNCACDAKTEAIPAPAIPPNNEPPPRSGAPSYQAEGIHADMPPSLISKDAQWNQEKADADAQGKKSAGIPK